jgi:catechol 2,3-dioxygenase-like lactoylglutathione lyase family enzyme
MAGEGAMISNPQFISLGWYVRFVPLERMEAMDRFYADVLGLPRMWHSRIADGKVENKDLYWAGEAIIENHNCGAPPDAKVGPRESDPATARQVPFYRVSDLDSIVAGLRAQGVPVIGPSPCLHGREACVLDPMNMLLGLRQIDADSPLPQDMEAARRRVRGEAFNPGCKPMPAGWQELGWVRIRAADRSALESFYADTLGLPRINAAGGPVSFDLGDNTILELESGGTARPPPALQMSSHAAIILRVGDALKLRAGLKGAGVHFVHDLIVHSKGNLCYVADPEGNVIGFSDRLHPGAYVEPLPTVLPPVSLEDAEAQRRWVESGAAAGMGH